MEVSGIYPHLAMFNSSGECGQGAVVPWAGKLWVVTYAPHAPRGSDDKLYEIDDQLHMTVREESVGGTPANRMIHRASEQLIIGPYFIDQQRNVRVIPYSEMPGRPTATAAHLTDPENKVYMLTMEEGLYEVDVHTLAVKVIYPDGNTNKTGGIDQPWLPGDHGKGAYTSQGLLVYASNGERKAAAIPDYAGPAGCLAQWDGHNWKVIERKQFTEVTGPGGIYGNQHKEDPVWSLGWDKRSVILKMLDHNKWYTYRLPKASFTYGAKHGWYTEWPRIREINDGRLLMTMFGMFWDFPVSFSANNTAGIRPLSSYLKMVVDFAYWHDRIVFGCDDASLLENKYLGQSQSNLWFVKPDDLTSFGPVNGFGGVWVDDTVMANTPSEPYLANGFDRMMIHLVNGSAQTVSFTLEKNDIGDHQWEEFKSIEIPPEGYSFYIFPQDFKTQWIRLKTDKQAGPVTAYLFSGGEKQRKLRQDPEIFRNLPPVEGKNNISFGLLRPRGNNTGTLQYAAKMRDEQGRISTIGYYEVGEDMHIVSLPGDTGDFNALQRDFPVIQDFSYDRASVILTDGNGNRYRIPRGDTSYYKDPIKTRGFREVVTERNLFNCQGTFYEVPRKSAGGYGGMKPVCTHNRIIYDYCSWRGMMVISGNLPDADENGHYFKSEDGKTGLWFGTVDDLWKLGKPCGEGGPWLQTAVKAGGPSDPYLMTGYDKKMLKLWSDRDVEVTAEISVDPRLKKWYTFKTFALSPGEKMTYNFPDGYQAHWIRFKTSKDCHVTAWLIYK